jgi:tetratricopeptide (TPR) repeat protein
LALAGTVVLALMLGGGGWLWVKAERDARQIALIRDVNEALNAATAFRTQGQLDRALEQAQRALALVETGPADAALKDQVTRLKAELDAENERNRPADKELGIALAFKGRWDEAIACFNKALEHDPKDAAVHDLLGLALYYKGQVDEAIACYNKALELDPKRASAHTNLGNALAEKGQLDEAIASYNKALELEPRDAQAHINLGKALGDKGRWDEAIACYKKALELHPKDAWAHFNLSAALYHKGQVDEALASYKKAMALACSRKATAGLGDYSLFIKVAAFQAWFGQDKELAETCRRGARSHPGHSRTLALTGGCKDLLPHSGRGRSRRNARPGRRRGVTDELLKRLAKNNN